jgi:pilus assembly protein Flp/PilA
MTCLLRKFWADQRGATAVEYGLLVALLGIVICGAITTLGTKLYTLITSISTAIH